jgi:hypothetical protein
VNHYPKLQLLNKDPLTISRLKRENKSSVVSMVTSLLAGQLSMVTSQLAGQLSMVTSLLAGELSMITSLLAGQPMNRLSIPCSDRRFFSYPALPDRTWVYSFSCSNDKGRSPSRSKMAEVWSLSMAYIKCRGLAYKAPYLHMP